MSLADDPYRSLSIREGAPLLVLLVTVLVVLATWRTPAPPADAPPTSETGTMTLATGLQSFA